MILNQSDIDAIVSKLVVFTNTVAVRTMAEVIIKEDGNRTESGLDSELKGFAPYEPRYATYGRERKGYTTSPVDLRRSGAYRDARYFDKDKKEVTVKSEYAKQAEGLLKKRTHIKANEYDIAIAEKAIADSLNQLYG